MGARQKGRFELGNELNNVESNNNAKRIEQHQATTQGKPTDLKLTTENQEHTRHTKTKHYQKNKQIFSNYKAPQNKSRTNL